MAGSNMLKINDVALIKQAKKAGKCLLGERARMYKKKTGKDDLPGFPFPLDEEIIGDGNAPDRLGSPLVKGEIPYSKADDLNKLWITLIEKSIQCLRFFETENPFQQVHLDIFEEKKKLVEAYEIESLKDYQKHYVEFECMLYGQNERYRDHVFHAFRVWLVGIFILTNKKISEDKEWLIGKLELDGGAEKVNEKIKAINSFEWLSMWTIAALCHDLGYPLELIGSVLDKTNEMMSDFFPRPNISDNFTFTGIQNVINDHILKFMSTKIEGDSQGEIDGQEEISSHIRDDSKSKIGNSENDKNYLGKIQQKYYFKYAKSLENSDHGIISAVIVFKKLPFFLETDFNLNNSPCNYSEPETHQFYIRREILRAMASHTCEDIFNVQIQTLPALLFVCDELQEWGRKSWKELYAGDNHPPKTKLSISRFDDKKVKIIETVEVESMSKLEAITEKVVRKLTDEYSLYKKYKKIFRNGPGTITREFDFEKKIIINEGAKQKEKQKELVVTYRIPQCEQNNNKQNNMQVEFEVNASNFSKVKCKKLRELFKEATKDSPYSYQFCPNPRSRKQ